MKSLASTFDLWFDAVSSSEFDKLLNSFSSLIIIFLPEVKVRKEVGVSCIQEEVEREMRKSSDS